jgi:hypothetical protein
LSRKAAFFLSIERFPGCSRELYVIDAQRTLASADAP